MAKANPNMANMPNIEIEKYSVKVSPTGLNGLQILILHESGREVGHAILSEDVVRDLMNRYLEFVQCRLRPSS